VTTRNSKSKKVDLENEVGRLRDTLEIQNLMSRYEYIHTYNDHKAVAELFTKNQPDAFVSIGTRGHWVGKDAAWRAYDTFIKMGPTPGLLSCNPITTPLIEVAGDRKTAKAMWVSSGMQAQIDKEGKSQCKIEWDRYAVDFMKEEGQWKIWHMQIFRIYDINRDQKWSDNPGFQDIPKPIMPDMYDDYNRPDGPSINVNAYSLKTVQNKVPPFPEPYETWDDSKTYGLPKKLQVRKLKK
jgi:hypothetical protein